MLRAALAPDYDCERTLTLDEAFSAVDRCAWEVALVDYDLGPHCSGLELLQAMREISPRARRILYSEHFCAGLVRDATRLAGAHAIIDARSPDFVAGLREALGQLLVPSRVPPAAPARADEGGELVWFAESSQSRELARRLREAAEGESAVFLFGEHGTGKHLAATVFRRWRAAWERRSSAPPPPGPRSPAVVVLAVPPLRHRIEDLPALAQFCLDRHGRQSGEPTRHLTNEALDDLLRRPWWGNVRELHGVLIRACQRAGPRHGLSAADLPRDAEPQLQPSQFAKDEGQRECVLRQLRTAGHVSGAARLEGITRTNYIRLMRRLGIIRADTLGSDADPVDPQRA